MKLILTCILGLILSSLMTSCEYNNEEELYPADVCDTTSVTYHATIVPIITQNCYTGCHNTQNPSSGFSFETYNGLKQKVDEQRLIGAIRHLSGFAPMPQNVNNIPLGECDILKIEKWVAAGAPHN